MVLSKTLMIVTLFSVTFAIIASTGHIQASEKKEECPANQEISCHTLRTTEGFTYPMSMNIPNSGDCEYAWYWKNGTCIAHSGGKKLASVVTMTLKNLTVTTCEDLQWQLHCDDIPLHCTVDYKVIEHERIQDGNHNAGVSGWVIASIVIGIVVAIAGSLMAVWCYCRNHENRPSY
ncbi:hypothetical protein QQF64_009955 [Cirrhinus molitorella]|uniref:Uncharacterized protein n=1 Tax=Cirrhinus molitorella TaxID=172907 RepID=A0ABR3M2M5_9TELE